jgi:hypothetical protein
MRRHALVQAERVRRLHAQQRAVFAEFLVEQLLSGSKVEVDPGAAWDLIWPVGRRNVRVQVKCSGEQRPRRPGVKTSPAWSLEPAKSAWDTTAAAPMPGGRNCDVYVLARHEGTDIGAGWTFWVLPSVAVIRDRNVRPMDLQAMGALSCEAEGLADAVRAALRRRAMPQG